MLAIDEGMAMADCAWKACLRVIALSLFMGGAFACTGCASSSDEPLNAACGLRIVQTDTGVRMLRDGKVLWNLEIETQEGRPFFHPLALPSGRIFTDLRPADHIWHLGYWFSWKYINGVNYWEPADQKRKGCEPEGRTRVVGKSVSVRGSDCRIRLNLEYGPRNAKSPVLSEVRDVAIDSSDSNGGYSITVWHRFVALADVTFDRTPPHGSVASGRWGGGYAGATLRLAAGAASAFGVRGSGGGATPAECNAVERKYLDFSDQETGEGVTFEQLKAPESARFYLWPDKRMINPSPVYTAPVRLGSGETMELGYRLAVHAGGRVRRVSDCK